MAQAPRRARALLERIRLGNNPADDVRRAGTTPTVGDFAAEYLRRYDPRGRAAKPCPSTFGGAYLRPSAACPWTRSAVRTWPPG